MTTWELDLTHAWEGGPDQTRGWPHTVLVDGVRWTLTPGWRRGAPISDRIGALASAGGAFDHLYVLRSEGRTVYACEPYELRNQDLTQILEVAGGKWAVTLWASRTIWNPTATIAVWFERRPKR